MSTPYNKIYSNVLSKFQSYEIPMMTPKEVDDYLYDFLNSAISKFYICRTDLNDRDEDLKEFNNDLSNLEIEILSNYLLLEYLDSTYIRTPTLLKVSLSSNDFHAFSNANQLDKLLSMHQTLLSENEGLLSRYAWIGIKKDKNSIPSTFNNSNYKKDNLKKSGGVNGLL